MSAIIQDFSPIVYNSDQLSFTAVPLSECMLSIWQKFMFVHMCHDIRAYCVCKQLAPYTRKGDRTVIASQRPITFFIKSGHVFARDHSLGISPVSIDCWNRWANIGPNSEASSFRTLGWSPSGPKALDGFKPLRSFITPTAKTTIAFMKGADQFGSGTWLCSFLLNTSVNWPLNSSACSSSDSATPLPFLLLRVGYLECLSFDHLCTDRSLWD